MTDPGQPGHLGFLILNASSPTTAFAFQMRGYQYQKQNLKLRSMLRRNRLIIHRGLMLDVEG
jgi:hypothetical protein